MSKEDDLIEIIAEVLTIAKAKNQAEANPLIPRLWSG